MKGWRIWSLEKKPMVIDIFSSLWAIYELLFDPSKPPLVQYHKITFSLHSGGIIVKSRRYIDDNNGVFFNLTVNIKLSSGCKTLLNYINSLFWVCSLKWCLEGALFQTLCVLQFWKKSQYRYKEKHSKGKWDSQYSMHGITLYTEMQHARI